MLAGELNALGCSRTAEEWQHIWSIWVAKVKGKARKVGTGFTGTGGGPAGADLTEEDNKILDIVGSASVYGFSRLEVGIPSPVPPRNMLPSVDLEDEHARSRSPLGREEGAHAISPRNQSTQTPPRGRPEGSGHRRRRRQLPRPARPLLNDNLTEVLRENGRLMAESIVRGAEIIAAAIAAIISAPIEIQHHDD